MMFGYRPSGPNLTWLQRVREQVKFLWWRIRNHT